MIENLGTDIPIEPSPLTNARDWVADNQAMLEKFGTKEVIRTYDVEKLRAFLLFRADCLQEELDELNAAKTADDAVDALIDLVVFAIGTLNSFEVDAYEAWNRVHAANMAKSPGVKAARANPLGLPDLIKPEGWKAPTHHDNVGLLGRVYGEKP